MVSLGRRKLTINRWLTRCNNVRATYPVTLWVEVIDYVNLHVWEYVYTDRGVFKRIWDGRDNQANWEYCRELCVYNRGWGTFEMFMQMLDIIKGEKDDASLQNL